MTHRWNAEEARLQYERTRYLCLLAVGLGSGAVESFELVLARRCSEYEELPLRAACMLVALEVARTEALQ